MDRLNLRGNYNKSVNNYKDNNGINENENLKVETNIDIIKYTLKNY